MGRHLYAAAFSIFSITNGKTGYSPGQLIFGRDMLPPIKHRVDWKLIRQQKYMQINIDNTRENKHIVDYDYIVGYKFMLTNQTAYKYEAPYKGPFLIAQCFTNNKACVRGIQDKGSFQYLGGKGYKCSHQIYQVLIPC